MCLQASDGVYSGDVALQMVPPLGALRFVVEPRKLPLISTMAVRLDSSLAGGLQHNTKDAGDAATSSSSSSGSSNSSGVSTESLQALVNTLLEGAAAQRKGGADSAAAADKDKQADGDTQEAEKDAAAKAAADAASSLRLYLQVRAALMGAFPDPGSIIVDFAGVESGRVEALVRARRATDPDYVSGLESSAEGGEGPGIDSFRPQRSSVQLSPGMLLPAEAAERLAAVRAARQAQRVLAPPQGWMQQ
jgi:hypothetical protein